MKDTALLELNLNCFTLLKYYLVFNLTRGLIQEHNDKQSFNLRVTVNLYVFNVLENCYAIFYAL